MLTVTIEDPVLEAGVEAACAAHNATLDEDATPLTPEEYLQTTVASAAHSYVTQFRIGTIFASDYVLRFTSAEWKKINDAAATDEAMAGYLQRVRALPEVRLWSYEMQSGHAYLVANGLLTAARSDEILSF